ncbi:hypothetical protein ACXWR7_12830, partial [Streptococcus pyogenes]
LECGRTQDSLTFPLSLFLLLAFSPSPFSSLPPFFSFPFLLFLLLLSFLSFPSFLLPPPLFFFLSSFSPSLLLSSPSPL